MAAKKKKKVAPGDVATNRYASYRYELLDRLECGIALMGTEVKSLRTGNVQIKDGFVVVDDGELYLHNVHIPPYQAAARDNHQPERTRKLLAHRREIDRLHGRVAERGFTLVPTRIYFKGPHAKVEVALAKGKDQFDKRQTLKEQQSRRDMDRALRDVGR
jgi:SsrA-binding protein